MLSDGRPDMRNDAVVHAAMTVTAIVTTRNSERTLARCLDSITRQTVPCEVIVVDNFSTDLTQALAQRFRLHFIAAGGERSRQRNVGARAASGMYLLFLDADMRAAPTLVEDCLAVTRRSRANVLIIPQAADGYGFLARSRALEKACYVGDPDREAPRFFRRDVFERLQGYDEGLVAGEDWDIALRLMRLGEPVDRARDELVEMYDRISLIQLFQKFRYYSPYLAQFRRKHPVAATRQMSPARPSLVRHWRDLFRHPILSLGIGLMKTTEVTGMAIGSIAPRRSLIGSPGRVRHVGADRQWRS
jgi:glycosyltransferase involved in cell wall biosynthesis